KRPDEGALSAALTEALTPLDQAVIADAAESFRSLEEERTGIADARATLGAAEAFLQHYRAYARVATRRHTSTVRHSNSAFEQAGRELSEAQEALASAVAEAGDLHRDHTEAQQHQAALAGQEQARRESPEMRDAQRLDQARQTAEETQGRVQQLASQEEAATVRAARDQDAAQEAGDRHETVLTELDRERAGAARLAQPAGLSEQHESIADDQRAAVRELDRRRDQIHHVASLIDAAEQAEAEARAKRTALDAAEADAVTRAEASRTAEQTLVDQAAEYRTAVRSHAAGLTELTLQTTPAELADAAEEWALAPAGPAPVPALLDQAVTQVHSGIERQRAQARHQAEQLGAALAEVEAEIAALEAGRDPEPPPVPGRDPAAREGAPGAPLWRVVDFSGSVSDDAARHLEAALQSAGLLDAWIFPDRSVRAAGEVVLGPSGPAATDPVSTVLAPAIGPEDEAGGLDAEAVSAVLDRIGLGDGSAHLWVSTDGSWGAGPVR